MTNIAGINPAVFDANVMALVQALIPSDRLHQYLGDLDQQFGMVVNSASSDATLESRAHKIVSQAGMLGLTRMAECARRVENACRAGSGQEAAVLNCSEAIADIKSYAMAAAGAVGCDEPAPPV